MATYKIFYGLEMIKYDFIIGGWVSHISTRVHVGTYGIEYGRPGGGWTPETWTDLQSANALRQMLTNSGDLVLDAGNLKVPRNCLFWDGLNDDDELCQTLPDWLLQMIEANVNAYSRKTVCTHQAVDTGFRKTWCKNCNHDGEFEGNSVVWKGV